MNQLRRAPMVPDIGRAADQNEEMTQAGRASSSLGAERNSAELRSQRSSSPTTITGTNPSVRSQSSSDMLAIGRRPSATSLNRRASYAPAIPSPLNPSSSRTSFNSTCEDLTSDDVTPTDSESSSEAARRQSAGGTKSKRNLNLSPSQLLLRQNSAINMRPDEMPRSETPRMLKDLGRDYSRYPSSNNISQCPSSNNISRLSSSFPGKRPSYQSSQMALQRTTTKNPFNDSQSDLENWGYPDDSIGTFDPYFGGEKGFILYSDQVEEDDKLHMPMDDDNITFRPKLSDYLDRRSVLSAIGGIFLCLGLLCVFIILPVLTFQTHFSVPLGLKNDVDPYGPAWAHVNNNTYPLLKNVRRGLVDPDTPASAKTRQSAFDGSTLNLVFSDEFNKNNRTFYPGDDPFWTAPNIWYGATQDLEWYDPDAVTTGGGTLQLRMDSFPNHNLQFRSGMLNSWNQLCFKGGVFEISVSLAGPAGVPGLWPGAWTLGNLGRPGYKATTEGVWPYTYNSCDTGITPNQSVNDGLSWLPGQKLNSCTCKGADHPSPGVGRGAPEIDILEGSVDPVNRIGVVTQSAQIAPFDVFYRPNSDFMAMPNYNTTNMNEYCGGPFQQAVSATTLLNNAWYDGNAYQKYAFEYIPGTSSGKIAWFVGEDPSFIMDGRAIGPNGNIAARQVSEEPMSMVLNLGISGSWSEILFGDLKFPTIMHVDYVRLYQKPGQTNVTCDPLGYPTTEYIAKHPVAYRNPNLTSWDETGYGWPKDTLTGC